MRKLRKGVRPLADIHEGKWLTQHEAIRIMEAPAVLEIPMAQHIGAPCLPCVEQGQRVLRYQRIGTVPEGKLGAPVHASVSGKVLAIEPKRQLSGRMSDCVIIENDGLDEEMPADWQTGTVETLSPSQIQAAAFSAGLVGMGGAAFPTHVKLAAQPEVDVLLVNAAECEPYLNCDNRLLIEQTQAVLDGLLAAQKAIGAKRSVIGIEKNKEEAILALNNATRGTDIEVMPLAVRYPQGSEKQLIFTTLRRVVPAGKLPLHVGVVVMNVGTLVALSAALRGIASVERVLTVSGDAVKKPSNLLVRVGVPIDAVFAACGGFTEEPRKIISGGPMMGIAQQSCEPPVKKATSGLLAFSEAMAWLPKETPCIHCGLCYQTCPMHLMPGMIYDAQRIADAKRAGKLSAQVCMECGSCAYICPARRPLVQGIRLAKSAILESQGKEKAGV